MKPAFVRLEPDGLLVFRDRIVEFPLAAQDVADVIMMSVVVGIESNGLSIFRDRLASLSLVLKRVSETGMNPVDIGLDLKGGAVLGDRVVRLPLTRRAPARLAWDIACSVGSRRPP